MVQLLINAVIFTCECLYSHIRALPLTLISITTHIRECTAHEYHDYRNMKLMVLPNSNSEICEFYILHIQCVSTSGMKVTVGHWPFAGHWLFANHWPFAGHWSLVIGHWSLAICWSLVIGHWPFAGQISNVATHFLVCLIHFRSNKARR